MPKGDEPGLTHLRLSAGYGLITVSTHSVNPRSSLGPLWADPVKLTGITWR